MFRKVVLLGDPVEHSLSPAMHNAAFRACGLDLVYETWRVARAELPAALRALRTDAYVGANVTIPHKEEALRLADAASAVATRVGAANTLVRRGGALHADNTDVEGFAAALAERGVDLAGKRALVLGAGGAARACVAALVDGAARACVAALVDGAARVSVAARRREQAERLLADVAAGRGEVAEWPRQLEGWDLVVNCTPLGLHGEDPLAGLRLRSGLVVFDLIPTAAETVLLRRAREAGCVAIDGLLMLLHQAAASFRMWTGRAAPLEAMRAALPRRV